MNIASVGAWLRRYVSDSVATDHIRAQEVPSVERQHHLRPASHSIGPVRDFKREVPHYPSVSLLALIRMLRYALVNTLKKQINLLVDNSPQQPATRSG